MDPMGKEAMAWKDQEHPRPWSQADPLPVGVAQVAKLNPSPLKLLVEEEEGCEFTLGGDESIAYDLPILNELASVVTMTTVMAPRRIAKELDLRPIQQDPIEKGLNLRAQRIDELGEELFDNWSGRVEKALANLLIESTTSKFGLDTALRDGLAKGLEPLSPQSLGIEEEREGMVGRGQGFLLEREFIDRSEGPDLSTQRNEFPLHQAFFF